jgi:hypothetical protein
MYENRDISVDSGSPTHRPGARLPESSILFAPLGEAWTVDASCGCASGRHVARHAMPLPRRDGRSRQGWDGPWRQQRCSSQSQPHLHLFLSCSSCSIAPLVHLHRRGPVREMGGCAKATRQHEQEPSTELLSREIQGNTCSDCLSRPYKYSAMYSKHICSRRLWS